MKRILIVLCPLLLNITSAFSQDTTRFEYWISSLDKAAYQRYTYHVTQDSIEIKSGPYDFIYFAKNYSKDKVVFKAALDSVGKNIFSKLGAAIQQDTFKRQYTNLCIMDGTILSFYFEWNDKIVATTLSNYYLEKMQQFVSFINEMAPEKYDIYYDKDHLLESRKKCPQEMILD